MTPTQSEGGANVTPGVTTRPRCGGMTISYREQRLPGEFESVQIVDDRMHAAVNALDDAIAALRTANEHALWLPESLEKFVSHDLLTSLEGLRMQEKVLARALENWSASLRPQEDPR